MSYIAHLRTELRVKVEAIEGDLGRLEAQIAHDGKNAQKLVRVQLEQLKRQLASKRPYPGMAWPAMRLGPDTSPRGDDPPWRIDAEELADAYNRAWIATDIALIAIDEAACAALEAWLAQACVDGAAAGKEDPAGPKHGE
jgi:hypothetical protein